MRMRFSCLVVLIAACAEARIDPRSDVVVIHDAARPLVTADLIRRTIDAAAEYGAAIAATAATDTVKRATADRVIVGTLPRTEIYLAQTPQAFLADVLRAALAGDVGGATDCASLVEAANGRVKTVPGDPLLVKVTEPGDLELIESVLRRDRQRAG